MDLIELRDRTMRELQKYSRRVSVDDVDDALNTVQRVYIQPEAKHLFTAPDYMTTGEEQVPLSDITNEPVYRLHHVMDVSRRHPGHEVPLLDVAYPEYPGVGLSGDVLIFRGIGFGRMLSLTFERALARLGTGPDEVLVPEIDPSWHDLYWRGAAKELAPGNEALELAFHEKMQLYRRERKKAIGGDLSFVVHRRIGD